MHKAWKEYPWTTVFIFVLGFETWVSAEVPLVAFPPVTAVEINTTAGLPCYMAYVGQRSGSAPVDSSSYKTFTEKCYSNLTLG